MNSQAVGQDVADRISVDIEGLREEIENAYPDDRFWRELSLAQKIRLLVQDGLYKAKSHKSRPDDSKPLGS